MMADVQVTSRDSFGFTDFLWRWLASLVLVFATYNPSGWCYVHWLRGALMDTGDAGGLGALHVLVGAILLGGWTVFLVATRNSLGTVGVIVTGLIIGAAIWLLVELGLVRAQSMAGVTWLVLFAVATLLAVGLSWSHVWRRLSGQLEVDDNDV